MSSRTPALQCGTLRRHVEIHKLLLGSLSLYWLHLRLALLMSFLQLLGFQVNRKGRGNSMTALVVAFQQQNCAALEGKVWHCEILSTLLPTHQSFREAGSPTSRMNVCWKAQDFSVKSRSPHSICSANHGEGQTIFCRCFWGKGNSKPARNSLGHGNSESESVTVNKSDLFCKALHRKPTCLRLFHSL